MSTPIHRREFLATTAAAGVAAVVPSPLIGQAPAVLTPRSAKPIVISSANGHRFKNGGPVTCVEKAFSLLTSGGDALDAVVAGVNIVELDPEDTSVGYGGLPNEEGVVQLDASVMHGPKKRAGGVACLEGVRTASLVAKAILENLDHQLLVGRDAQRFARQVGFTIEDDLNTPRSRALWLEWKRRAEPEHFLDPSKRAAAGLAAGLAMVAEGLVDPDHFYGTINCTALGPTGAICSVTTTSGMAFKIPGRVGDSPIVGAGLYVDNEVGAAGSTGRGEANLYGLNSFLIVEEMRRGRSPKDAGVEALRRIQKNTVEARLLNSRGLPKFDVSFYVVNAAGQHAGVSLYGSQYAICTENGGQVLPTDALFEGKSEG
jgi:N4-(beta-N-acetylglucosaminyl)-L-asparaginase